MWIRRGDRRIELKRRTGGRMADGFRSQIVALSAKKSRSVRVAAPQRGGVLSAPLLFPRP